MESVEIVKSAQELIEKAKSLSKEKIVSFVREQYNVDANSWAKLWSVPVVATYEYEKIFPAQLTNVDEDMLLDKIDECVEAQLGDAPMAVIPTEYIISELPVEAMEEYDQSVERGDYIPEYSSTIVYDEAGLISMYREHLSEGTKAGYTKEQIDEVYLRDLAKHFIHERLHINTNNLIVSYQDSEQIDAFEYDKEHEDDSEVILDMMARIISTHKTGRTINEDLNEVLAERAKVLKLHNTLSYYEEKEDSLVTSMFTLFPEEFAKWIMLDGCKTTEPNVYIDSCNKVLGKGSKARGTVLYGKIRDYFNTNPNNMLFGKGQDIKKKQMELLGITNLEQVIVQTDKQQLREVAISDMAMAEVETCGRAIQQVCKDIQENNRKSECLE